MLEISFYIAAFLLAFTGVEVFRRWSIRKNIYDIPNERSSHAVPTPRGGGLVVVSVCLLFYLLLPIFFEFQISMFYVLGAVIVAVISWLDDLFTISAFWRFLAHTAVAFIAIWGIGFPQQIFIPLVGAIDFGYLGFVLWFLWIVWLINAYNFMDGIDGIAGTQALTAGIGWLFLLKIFGVSGLDAFAGVIAAAGFGFLIHNWHPAKIFMGDVGSAFLGYTFAVLPLLTAKQNPEVSEFVFLIGVLLLWFFVFDSVITFLRRLLKGEKVWQAHREHLYQRLIKSNLSHSFVTALYGVLSAIIVATMLGAIYMENSQMLVSFAICCLFSILLFIYVTFVEKKSDLE